MSPETVTQDTPGFADEGLLDWLHQADDAALDRLDFGVIGFGHDADALVQRYNRAEQRGSGLAADGVLGQPLFSAVAQCMNNYLVAQLFEDALADGTALDQTLAFVFTLRMRPTPVTLRLLSRPTLPLRFVLVQRQ